MFMVSKYLKKKPKLLVLYFAIVCFLTFTLPVWADEKIDQTPVLNEAKDTTSKNLQIVSDELLNFEKKAFQESDKTYSIKPLVLNSAIEVNALKPIHLDSQYDEVITLERALKYALRNSLNIRISKENWNFQHYTLLSTIASALPNNYLSYNLTNSNLLNIGSTAFSRVFQSRQSFPVFQGGAVVYGILGQLYRNNGWKEMYFANVNDSLLDVYIKYTNLVLNHALLQVRAQAVAVSMDQLNLNKALFKQGTGTNFAVMQAQTQLANDRQAYLQQQLLNRQASLALAFALNYPLSVNLIPAENVISDANLIKSDIAINKLTNLAHTYRHELKEFEQFRLSANRNIQSAMAPLYPTISFFTLYSYVNTTSTVASSSGTSGAGVFGGLYKEFQMGLSLTWTPPAFGLQNVANTLGAKALARQAQFQANQELQLVRQQIRTDYVNLQQARNQIETAQYNLNTASEELRLARLRFKIGSGSNVELNQARSDYNNAQISKLQTIIAVNQAQVQLLHDVGVISLESLLHGYKYN